MQYMYKTLIQKNQFIQGEPQLLTHVALPVWNLGQGGAIISDTSRTKKTCRIHYPLGFFVGHAISSREMFSGKISRSDPARYKSFSGYKFPCIKSPVADCQLVESSRHHWLAIWVDWKLVVTWWRLQRQTFPNDVSSPITSV